jgi:3-oxoacyl-[acyl-carrier protein] reductase
MTVAIREAASNLLPIFSVLGKKAFVSGGSRGIGRACALTLAAAGADVAIGSSAAGVESAESVCREIRELGRRAEAYACDVGTRGAVKMMCARVTEEFETIDILVNNAGVTRDGLFRKMDREAWDTVINTNLNSVFEITQNFIEPMAARGWGRVINISSIVGQIGNFGQANYAAAKAGLIGMTATVAAEVARRGVTVNAVAPGFIQTDMTEELSEDWLKLIPARRLGTPEDVAAAVRFLASEDAAYVTGTTLTVDGGLTA